MWVEYTILPNNKYKDIFYNLFPMIYCKTLSGMTKQLSSLQDKNITKKCGIFIFMDLEERVLTRYIKMN